MSEGVAGFAVGVALGFVTIGVAGLATYAAARPHIREWSREAIEGALRANAARADREERDPTARLIAQTIGAPSTARVIAGVLSEVLEQKLP